MSVLIGKHTNINELNNLYMNDACNTNPVSTNQVIEVGVRKPKCFDFDGNSLNNWLSYIAEQICCILNDNKETVENITVNSNWSVDRPVKLYKRGNFVQLSGEVLSGDVSTSIFTFPYSITSRKIVPLAHAFTPTDTYRVYLKIDTDKSVKLYFVGTAPTGASSKLFLDGVSFFLED